MSLSLRCFVSLYVGTVNICHLSVKFQRWTKSHVVTCFVMESLVIILYLQLGSGAHYPGEWMNEWIYEPLPPRCSIAKRLKYIIHFSLIDLGLVRAALNTLVSTNHRPVCGLTPPSSNHDRNNTHIRIDAGRWLVLTSVLTTARTGPECFPWSVYLEDLEVASDLVRCGEVGLDIFWSYTLQDRTGRKLTTEAININLQKWVFVNAARERLQTSFVLSIGWMSVNFVWLTAIQR